MQQLVSYMGVSKNNGTPKSSILIGISIVNHPFWGTTIFGNIHMDLFGAKDFDHMCFLAGIGWLSHRPKLSLLEDWISS